MIDPIETNFKEIINEIHIASFKKMYLKMSPAKCRPFYLVLNVLTQRESIHMRVLQGKLMGIGTALCLTSWDIKATPHERLNVTNKQLFFFTDSWH